MRKRFATLTLRSPLPFKLLVREKGDIEASSHWEMGTTCNLTRNWSELTGIRLGYSTFLFEQQVGERINCRALVVREPHSCFWRYLSPSRASTSHLMSNETQGRFFSYKKSPEWDLPLSERKEALERTREAIKNKESEIREKLGNELDVDWVIMWVKFLFSSGYNNDLEEGKSRCSRLAVWEALDGARLPERPIRVRSPCLPRHEGGRRLWHRRQEMAPQIPWHGTDVLPFRRRCCWGRGASIGLCERKWGRTAVSANCRRRIIAGGVEHGSGEGARRTECGRRGEGTNRAECDEIEE